MLAPGLPPATPAALPVTQDVAEEVPTANQVCPPNAARLLPGATTETKAP